MKITIRFMALAAMTSFICVAARSADAGDAAQRTREFAVMGYEGLAADLDQGDGPYVRTLMELLGVAEADRPRTLERVRAVEKANPNIMDFADAVAALQTSTAAAAAVVPVPSGPATYAGDRLEGALTHLTRGMKVTVYTRDGGRFAGIFDEYAAGRLWVTGGPRRWFRRDDILAVESKDL